MVSLHQHLHQRAPVFQGLGDMERHGKRDSEPQVVSVVLVTLTPTFSEDVAGYTTLTDDSTQSSDSADSTSGGTVLGEPAQQPATTTDSDVSSSIEATSSATGSFNFQTTSSTVATSSSIAPTSSSLPSVASSLPTTSAIVASTSAVISSSQQYNSAVPNASPSSSSSSDTNTTGSSQGGLSTGGKAGLAIGIILMLAAVAAGVLFLYAKKKKRSNHDNVDNEKTAFGTATTAAAKPPMSNNTSNFLAPAPRLSLRPMSRLLPEFGGGAKKRASQGNMLSTFNEAPVNNRSNLTPSPRPQSPWERRQEEAANTNNPFNDPQNPFADTQHAAAPASVGIPSYPEPAPAAFPAETAAVAAVAAGTAGAAVAGTDAIHHHGPQLQIPPSQPMANAAPAVGPAPVGANLVKPADGPPGNVFRVQMEFKPKMDDELELRAGELVRLVHEYDDGWALCMRLDRSHQGVAPRTCLAANPSKPRPPPGAARGPGPNEQMRPGPNARMGPAVHRSVPSNGSGFSGRHSPAMKRPASPVGQMRGSRPSTPNGGRTGREQMRPMSPGGYNQAPRPLSPGPRPSPQRSMSPGPYGPGGAQKPRMPAAKRQRSNSVGALNVRERREQGLKPSRLGPGSPPNGRASPGVAI